MVFFVHESSFIDDNVVIGDGVKIWHFCHILKNTKIGSGCVLGQNVMVGPNVIIRDNVKIQNNVSIYDGVELEDNVFCGPSMVFTNVINPRSFIERKHEFKKTLVREGASLGANCTIVCGITIGRYALIGAGAVVVKDVPDYGMMLGVPAVRKGWICKCGVTLHSSGTEAMHICSECGSKYKQEGDFLTVIEETI